MSSVQSTTVQWMVNDTVTDGLVDTQPMLTPGESAEYGFGFYGDTAIERYDQVRQITQFPGQFSTYEAINGDVYWREQRDGTSQLVHIRPAPGADSPTGRGIWGLLDSISDETTYSKSRCQLVLSVIFIASDDDYPTEGEIRDAREVTGP